MSKPAPLSYEARAAAIRNSLFRLEGDAWTDLALDVFSFQYDYNDVYRQYADLLHKTPGQVSSITEIPFLPISQFKLKQIQSGIFNPALIFESSGTTGSVNSRHEVKDKGLYEESFLRGFNRVYGNPEQYCVIGLLPSYLERGQSSLVYMTDRLIRESRHPQSGFHLYDYERVRDILVENETAGHSTLLIGVTYALLDLAEQFPLQLTHTIIMETGGMKGRKREITREEVHAKLCEQFGVKEIHSEYGMTELLSQAYSTGNGRFQCPPWMHILLRSDDDPFELFTSCDISSVPRSGVINVIDLANLYSCSFIATDDLGKLYPDGSFEVLGRLDHSDIRGCSLMLGNQ